MISPRFASAYLRHATSEALWRPAFPAHVVPHALATTAGRTCTAAF